MKPLHQFLIILLLASVFRLTFMDLIEFKFDEAFTVFQMTGFYNQPELFQTGPIQSTGMYNFPIFNYLMIPLSLFSRHPQYLSFVIALINSVLVGVFFLIVRKFYSQKTAWLAAIFLCFSPWAIIFSRKIWMPDLILILIIPALYFLSSLILKRNIKSSFWLFLLLTLAFQFHAAGAFFTVATILILVILKIKIDIKKALKGVGLGLILAIPYFIRQLTSDLFCIDCVLFLKYQQIPKTFDFQNFLRPLQFMNGQYFDILLGKDYLEFLSNPLVKNLDYIFYVSFAVLILSCILILKYRREFLFLILYILIIPTMYLITRTPSYAHYFVVLFPVIAIIYGIGLSITLDLVKSKFLKIAVYILFTVLILGNIIFEINFIRFLSDKKIINGDYGPVFSETEKFINQELTPYLIFPEYDQIKSYAYFFPNAELLHTKLGEYFLQRQGADLAISEFNKALIINPKDVFSRANLTYILIMQNKKAEAEQQINVLEQANSTISAQLKNIMQQKFK